VCTYDARFFGAGSGTSFCSVSSTPTQDDEALLCGQEAAGAWNMQQEQAEAGRRSSYSEQETQEIPHGVLLHLSNDKTELVECLRARYYASCVVSEIVPCILAQRHTRSSYGRCSRQDYRSSYRKVLNRCLEK
jgi:hypothetical protein